jgi:uncharacterized protein (TIGR02147 family)
MDIYQYEDYRHFLRDRFNREKASTTFSWRKFASAAGFSNPGYVNDVIIGTRRLSMDAVGKLITYFSLLPHEAEFFHLLVSFSHARTMKEKDRIYREIIFRRSHSNFAQVNAENLKYYQDYRYPLVRCALMTIECTGESAPERVAKFCDPPLSVTAVRRILSNLRAWGLVTVDKNGTYSVNDRFVEPSPELTSQIRQINREWILQAQEALMTVDAQKRHISSMLLAVSSPLREEIKKKIELFRSEVWEMVKNDSAKADSIMLLNTQYFPRSKKGRAS